MLREENAYVRTVDECKKVAQAKLDRLALNYVSGSGLCLGLPELIPGRFITIEGLDGDTVGDYFITKVRHQFGSGGYLTQFYPYTGPVTYLAITQDGEGHFKFVVAEGVNEEGKILSFGDTNMRTRFTCGAREFVTRWSECGPTHHFAAATGRHIDTILKVAKIFNVPVDIVTR